MAIAMACALLLALPGETVTTKYLNDLFIFLDGVHRISAGQVPNRDFHTALGPLVYYAPAAGYWLSGSFGAAMPVGMALIIAALAPVAAHILSSRLRLAIAIPLAAFLFLIAAVPINPGEGIEALSFAMFYNRIGWVALGFLLIMYVRPSRQSPYQILLDTGSAAFLVILMLYMKISYGLVGAGFLIMMLLDSRQWRWAAAAIASVLAIGLTIEAFWGGTAGHLKDLLLAGGVSGKLSSIAALSGTFLRSLADYALFILFSALLLWRTRSVRDLLFLAFCAGAGFMLIIQNYQSWGIFSLPVGAAAAAELVARTGETTSQRQRRLLTVGVQLALLAFLLPAAIHNAAALGLHARLAGANQGQPVPLPNFKDIRLVQLQSEGDFQLFNRYLASLEDGARAIEGLELGNSRVVVLDFVSPFSAGLGLRPPHGDSTWYHWGRTVNEENYLPADELFRTAHVVMDPKWPIEVSTAEGLRRLYSDYVEEHFDLAQETADWKVYVRRTPSSQQDEVAVPSNL